MIALTCQMDLIWCRKKKQRRNKNNERANLILNKICLFAFRNPFILLLAIFIKCFEIQQLSEYKHVTYENGSRLHYYWFIYVAHTRHMYVWLEYHQPRIVTNAIKMNSSKYKNRDTFLLYCYWSSKSLFDS